MSARLSVIVPFHNPGRWMADWLDSLRAQTMGDFACIVVDDGSTDGSAAALASAVANDARFQILHQPNRGPAAARNAGLDRVRTPFLTFCDPDDTLPPDAYARLVAAMASGSADYASGAVLRLSEGRLRRSGLHRRFHAENRTLHPDDLGELAFYDQLGPNKLFATAFFRTHVGGFPDQRRYEDIAPMTRAMLAARRIAVLSAPVYHWRTREDGSSLTQGLGPAALADRLTALRATLADVTARRPDLRAAFLRKALRHDLSVHLRAAAGADEDTRRATGGPVAEFQAEAGGDWAPGLAQIAVPLRNGRLRKALGLIRADEADSPPGFATR